MRKLDFSKHLLKSLGDNKFLTTLPVFFGLLLITDIILFGIHHLGPETTEMVEWLIDLFIYLLLFFVLFVPLIRDHQNLRKTTLELQENRGDLEVRVRERTAELMASYEQNLLQLTAMESAAEGIVITDRNGFVLWCNAAMTSITGYLTDELIGQRLSILKSGKHPPEIYADLWGTLLNGKTWQGVFINRRKDGRHYYEEQTITPVANERGEIERFVAIKHDITQRKLAEQELIHRNWELRTLNYINSRINGLLEKQAIFHLLADLIPQEISNLGGAIFSRDMVSGTLYKEIGWNSTTHLSPELEELQPHVREAVAEAIQNRKVYFLPASSAGMPTSVSDGVPGDGSDRAYVITPLLYGELVLGVLLLMFENLDNRHIDYFKALGNQVGAAIQTANLYQEEIHLRQIAEIVSSANQSLVQTLDLDTVLQSMFQFLSKLVPYNFGEVMLVDGDEVLTRRARSTSRQKINTGFLEPPSVHVHDHPLLAQILDQKKPVQVADTQSSSESDLSLFATGTRCWLGIPLRTGGQVVGVTILEGNEPYQFSSEHVSIAVILVDQAAVAIQNAWLFDQLREGRNRLQILSRRLVEIQESERKYIARELHDEASQALVGLRFGLNVLRDHSSDPTVVIAEVAELETRIHEILDNLHRLASNLRPASLDHLGFVPALRQFINGINEKYGITVNLQVEGPVERLQQNADINLYRIVQEALNNTIRHARASRAEVYLRKTPGWLTASIMDDGVGFDPAAVIQGDRLGLFGMRERAEMIGGKVIINSVPGEGTTIFVEIPDDH